MVYTKGLLMKKWYVLLFSLVSMVSVHAMNDYRWLYDARSEELRHSPVSFCLGIIHSSDNIRIIDHISGGDRIFKINTQGQDLLLCLWPHQEGDHGLEYHIIPANKILHVFDNSVVLRDIIYLVEDDYFDLYSAIENYE